jgi:SAM-dependent methyltransferase
MLAELRGEQQRRGIENVIASQGDGMALPYADGGFAAGFSLFGLMFFPDRAKGFAELHRVLAPGGVALVTSWAPLDLSPLMALMFSALRATDPSIPAPTRSLTNLENPEVFVAELRAAGFVDVAVEPVEQLVTLGSAEDFWAAITRSAAPCALMRRSVGDEEWARRSRLAREHLEAAFSRGPQTLGTTAYFGFGRRAG